VHSVYDYFKLSQFFRRDCNNGAAENLSVCVRVFLELISAPIVQPSEQLRQAGQDPSLANLRRLPGCEYQVREIPASGPGLQSNFLVYQQNRRDPDTVEVVQIFFVAGGTVFPMPTLHEVFSNQLVRCEV
jgi:hypothetical protein